MTAKKPRQNNSDTAKTAPGTARGMLKCEGLDWEVHRQIGTGATQLRTRFIEMN
jgi:hypothetical protein